MDEQSYFGIYQGIVAESPNGPLPLGRICVRVPDLFGDQVIGPAWPCLPFAGDKLGFFAVPPKDTLVWIMFEMGHPDLPVWMGSFWEEEKEMPALPKGAKQDPDSVVMICTKGGHSILLDDAQSGGGITFKTSGGQKIVINSQSIEIDNGNGAKIELKNSQVSINSGALEVS
jgi:uncharacterized protein involved in type VI secretion and phage assembly